MKKTFAALIALTALSGVALAAADDHGGNGQDNKVFQTKSSTEAFEVAPVTTKGDRQIENYLNWNQLR